MGLQNINSQIWTGNSLMLSLQSWPLVFPQIQIHPLFVQCSVQVPYMVQQIMSAKLMPVLSGAVPSFEIFITWWEKLCTTYPELKPWVDVRLRWAKKYYTCMDNTNAYVIAMCELLLFFIQILYKLTTDLLPSVLNPCICFKWITCHWEGSYIRCAKAMIIDLVST